MFNQDIQDSDEYNDLAGRIAEIGTILTNEYVYDKSEFERYLDEIQANVTKLRELLEIPESDRPDNLDASPFLHNVSDISPEADSEDQPVIPDNVPEKGDKKNLRAVREDGTFAVKGDVLTNFRNEAWTFDSVTGPRKVFVTDKEDENGPDSHPNMISREFYASVVDLGIWDVQYEDWTFTPEWDEKTIAYVTAKLTKPEPKH